MFTVLEKKCMDFRQKVEGFGGQVGRRIELEGYLARSKDLDRIFSRTLWLFRNRYNCDAEMYLFSVIPESVARFKAYRAGCSMPVLVLKCVVKVPRYKSSLMRIGGTIAKNNEIENFGGYSLILEYAKPVAIDEYFRIGAPQLRGDDIRVIVDSAFDEDLRGVMRFKLAASSTMADIFAGTSVGLGVPNIKGYGIHKKEWKELKKSIPAYIRGGEKLMAELDFGEEYRVKSEKKVLFPTGYDFEEGAKFIDYSENRVMEKWQKRERSKGRYLLSESGKGALKAEVINILNVADAPFLPLMKDARVVDSGGIREYAIEIAYYSFYRYLEEPIATPAEYYVDAEILIGRIKKEFPEIYRYMLMTQEELDRIGVPLPEFRIYDSSKGFGLHLKKLLNSARWIGEDRDKVWDIYLEPFFIRMEELYGRYLRNVWLYSMQMGATEKMLRSALLDLNILTNRRTVRGESGWTIEDYIDMVVYKRELLPSRARAMQYLNALINRGRVKRVGTTIDDKELYWYLGGKN